MGRARTSSAGVRETYDEERITDTMKSHRCLHADEIREAEDLERLSADKACLWAIQVERIRKLVEGESVIKVVITSPIKPRVRGFVGDLIWSFCGIV